MFTVTIWQWNRPCYTHLKWSFSDETDGSLCPCPLSTCVRLVPCHADKNTIIAQNSNRQNGSRWLRAGTPPELKTSSIPRYSRYRRTNKHSATSRWPWWRDNDVWTTCIPIQITILTYINIMQQRSLHLPSPLDPPSGSLIRLQKTCEYLCKYLNTCTFCTTACTAFTNSSSKLNFSQVLYKNVIWFSH